MDSGNLLLKLSHSLQGWQRGSQVDPKVNMWKKSSVLGLAHCHLPFLELPHVF